MFGATQDPGNRISAPSHGSQGKMATMTGERGVVLRRWRMPVLGAVLCLTVWPLTAAVLVAAALAVVFGWDSTAGDLVLGWVAFGLYGCGVVGGIRSLLARVVVTAEEVRVHNPLSTTRIRWADVEAVEEVSFINVLALFRADWYGTAIRVRGRTRPLRIMASWSNDAERAAELRRQIRPPGPRTGIER